MFTLPSSGAGARRRATSLVWLAAASVACARTAAGRDVIELAARPIRPPEPKPRELEVAPPPSPETPTAELVAPEGAGAAVEASPASPWTVWVGSSTAFQSMQGAKGATNDYVTGYLDIVLDGRLWEGAMAQVEFEGSGGNGPDVELPGFVGLWNAWNANGGTYQSPDGFDRLLLAEAYVSLQSAFEGWIVDVGKLATTNYIDTVRVANNSVGNFLAGAFTNSVAFRSPFRGGGFALTYVGSGDFDFRAVAVRPDNSGDDATSNLFGAAQVSVYWGQDARPGAAYLYSWSNGGDGDRTGVGLNLDQDFGAHTTAFARAAWADEVDAGGAVDTAVETSWVAGLECRGSLWERDNESCALALGLNSSHDPALEDEFVLEAYFKRVVNDYCEVSLHLHGIDNLGGDSARDFITALGLRVNIWL